MPSRSVPSPSGPDADADADLVAAGRPAAAPVDPTELDIGSLALFFGLAAAAEVEQDIAGRGLRGLRFSHGYVFQHLIDDEPTIGRLADALDMTQQGASKAVAELERLGYVERVPDPADARVRRVRLNARGRAAVDAARGARRAQDERLAELCGTDRLEIVRTVLAELLESLNGSEAVRRRRLRPPR